MKDFRLGSTFDIKFTTRQASGAPFTLAGSPAISIYADNSTTQSTTGVTLTPDFDGVTGLNNVRVVATTANGYAAGVNYQVVITAGTVNGVSVVGEVIDHFTLDVRARLAGLKNSGTVSAVTSTSVFQLGASASANDGAYENGYFNPTGGTGADQNGSNIVNYVGATKEVTVDPPLDQIVGTDTTYDIFMGAGAPETPANLPLARSYNHEGNPLALATEVAALDTDLTSVATELSGAVTSINTLLGRLTAGAATNIQSNIASPVATTSDMATVLARTSNLVARLADIANMFTAFELDGAVYRFTTNALENAPAGGGGGSADWTAGEKEQMRYRWGIDGTATAPTTATPNLATQASVNAISTAVITSGVALSSAAIAATLAAFKADTQWKTMLAGSEGDWTATLPATYPGTGTLILKDKDGVTTRVTQTLTFDSSGRIIERASA